MWLYSTFSMLAIRGTKQYNNYYPLDCNSDVQVAVGDSSLLLQKGFLQIQSGYFKALFKNDPSLKKVRLTSQNSECKVSVISVLFGKQVPLTESNVPELLRAVLQLQVKCLEPVLQQFIKANYRKINLLSIIYDNRQTYQQNQLFNTCFNLAAQNPNDFLPLFESTLVNRRYDLQITQQLFTLWSKRPHVNEVGLYRVFKLVDWRKNKSQLRTRFFQKLTQSSEQLRTLYTHDLVLQQVNILKDEESRLMLDLLKDRTESSQGKSLYQTIVQSKLTMKKTTKPNQIMHTSVFGDSIVQYRN